MLIVVLNTFKLVVAICRLLGHTYMYFEGTAVASAQDPDYSVQSARNNE